uniref:Sulfotransferase domain-containing protein n=1 Tax=Guillardia theta TaxID=55529 RepID=A0A7S4KR35_GUITH
MASRLALLRRMEELRWREVHERDEADKQNLAILKREVQADGDGTDGMKEKSEDLLLRLFSVQSLRTYMPHWLFSDSKESVKGWKERIVEESDELLKLVNRKFRPDFMLLGSSKCGTSSVIRYLLAVPEVSLASRVGMIETQEEIQDVSDEGNFDPLETHIFDQKVEFSPVELMRAQCIAYSSRLQEGQGASASMLAHYTPHYIYHPMTPYNLERLFGSEHNIRFLVMLREPVARAVSSYYFKVKTERESRTLAEAISAGIQYHTNMRHKIVSECGLDHDAEVVCLEDAEPALGREEMVQKLKEIYIDKTLPDCPPLHDPNLFNDHVGKGVYHEQLRRWMHIFPKERFYVCTLEEFSQDPVGKLSEMLSHIGMSEEDIRKSRSVLEQTVQKKWNVTQSSSSSADQEVLEQLKAFYAPHNEKLFQLLGRRLWGM